MTRLLRFSGEVTREWFSMFPLFSEGYSYLCLDLFCNAQRPLLDLGDDAPRPSHGSSSETAFTIITFSFAWAVFCFLLSTPWALSRGCDNLMWIVGAWQHSKTHIKLSRCLVASW